MFRQKKEKKGKEKKKLRKLINHFISKRHTFGKNYVTEIKIKNVIQQSVRQAAFSVRPFPSYESFSITNPHGFRPK